jgi:pimeloyl-ACP methyl ester carboxylesterase
MENCLLDMGSMVRHLRASGYERVVLVGNSGGASIVPYYQAQALAPSVTSPPGGGPDLTQAGLDPADAIAMFNAHPSRARIMSEWLDPAIVDELRPFERDPSLDMYDPANGPPYAPEFVERYRAAQLARNRRISAWAEEQLQVLTAPGHFPEGLADMAFTVHGTTADLRLLDGAIDPSDREVGMTSWGQPAVANYLPAGVARSSTLRSWLNQWSVDDSLGDSLRWLPQITSSVFVGAGTADEVVVPQMARQMYDVATAASSRTWVEFKGGTHYFTDHPEVLDEALDALAAWLETV